MNLVISFIRERAGVAGEVIAGIAGVAWGLVTFLVVPVIALEGLGPWQALKRSGSLFRQRWGEQITGNLAIGIGILYALVVEGLISAFASAVSWLEPITEFFLRANAYSLVRPLGLSVDDASSNGPGAFSGPYVDGAQALPVLALYAVGFLLLSGFLLRRRDVQV